MGGMDVVEGDMNDKGRNTEQCSKNKSENPSISVGEITIVSDIPKQTHKHKTHAHTHTVHAWTHSHTC